MEDLEGPGDAAEVLGLGGALAKVLDHRSPHGLRVEEPGVSECPF